jgi:hypothetical protein
MTNNDPQNTAQKKKKIEQEEFEDIKWVIRISISKNRQHKGQKKKYKRTNNGLQNINRVTWTPLKTGMNSGAQYYWHVLCGGWSPYWSNVSRKYADKDKICLTGCRSVIEQYMLI